MNRFLTTSAMRSLTLALCASGMFVFTPALAQEADTGTDIQMLMPEDEGITPDAPALEAPPAANVVDEEIIPVPELQTLEAPAPALERPDPTPSETVPELPEAPESAEAFDENLFFDAEAIVPTSELSSKGAPSKVNPVLNPASALVITMTDAKADSKQAQLVGAERAMKLGRYESALEIYNKLYSVNKRDPNILMGRAVALQQIGRHDEAIRAYEELLEIRPENRAAQINMQGLISKHYPAVAMRTLSDLYESNPDDVGIAAQLAVTEAQLGHYPEAIRYLGIAASMEPENANHVYNMAVIADRAGDKKSAIKYYEEALELDTLYGAGRSIPREAVYERLATIR